MRVLLGMKEVIAKRIMLGVFGSDKLVKYFRVKDRKWPWPVTVTTTVTRPYSIKIIMSYLDMR